MTVIDAARRGAPGAGRDRPGDQRGAVRVPVRARRRAAGAVLGAGRHRGRAPARGGGDARLRRLARPGHRQRSAPSSSPWACSPALLATIGAAAIGQLLARRVFELDLPPSPELWIAGPLAGLALLSLNAWLSSRKVLRASPALTLRDSGRNCINIQHGRDPPRAYPDRGDLDCRPARRSSCCARGAPSAKRAKSFRAALRRFSQTLTTQMGATATVQNGQMDGLRKAIDDNLSRSRTSSGSRARDARHARAEARPPAAGQRGQARADAPDGGREAARHAREAPVRVVPAGVASGSSWCTRAWARCRRWPPGSAT